MILIDNREPKYVLDVFDRLNIEYKVIELPVGDFTNEEVTFIVERKGFTDFWNSMTDGRLYEQYRRLAEHHERPYVFVETGCLADWAEEKKQNLNWIYSMFGEAENWGINFREYVDLEDLARKLVSLDKKLGTEHKIRDKKPIMFKGTVGERILSQIPGIGKKLAKEILKQSHSLYAIIEDVMDNNAEGIRSVKNVGKGIAFNIKEVLLEYHDNI